jgi:hypothetical protein
LIGRPTGVVEDVGVATPAEPLDRARDAGREEEREDGRGVERELGGGIPQSWHLMVLEAQQIASALLLPHYDTAL